MSWKTVTLNDPNETWCFFDHKLKQAKHQPFGKCTSQKHKRRGEQKTEDKVEEDYLTSKCAVTFILCAEIEFFWSLFLSTRFLRWFPDFTDCISRVLSSLNTALLICGNNKLLS